MKAVPFRFDAARHTYTALDTGEALPHITGMLRDTGWVDDDWYTAESAERGKIVHALTAEYDLDALAPADCTSLHKNYLLAYVEACRLLGVDWSAIEDARIHPFYRFGGRVDRIGRIFGAHAVAEIKSGPFHASHPIQTALQAMLIADELRLPAPAIQRYGIYVRADGRFKVEHFRERRDFDHALRVIRRTCS